LGVSGGSEYETPSDSGCIIILAADNRNCSMGYFLKIHVEERMLKVSDFVGFEKMIAVTVVKVLYWFGLAAIAIGGIVNIVGSFRTMGYSFSMGLGQFLLTFIGIAVAAVLWRVLCELYIVVFSMHDRLGEIRDRLSKQD
jgi:hypothetical protein